MHRILAPAILALTLAAAPAASAETRNHSGFDGVAAQDQIEVIITMGDTYSVQVTGSDAERVRTEVREHTLHIKDRRRPWFGSHDLDAVVRVTMPQVEDIAAARGAEVTATNIIAEAFEIAAAMGGVIEISGTCTDLDASVAMGGVLEAGDFHCVNADVSAAMGGVAEIYASNSFDASAAMGGAIDISGDAHGDSSSAMGGQISLRR
jgi:hypothetical protein